jgi:hypothetical protein
MIITIIIIDTIIINNTVEEINTIIKKIWW